MAYPTTLDSFTNPSATSGDTLASVPHDSQHTNANNAIVALETKVGINASAVTTTIDYLLKNSASIDPGHHHTNSTLDSIASSKITGVTFPSGTIVGTTDTQSLTNKTITDSTNNVMAKSLKSATTTVDVSAATAPSSGQVLTATDSTHATWQAGGGSTDGWTSSPDTWTYVSASSFKVTSKDVTGTYTKGTRLKFTQTTVKYAVVVSSSFSTDTTVNIAVNTDYTLANATITSPFYSYQANPQGYPTWFNFTPSYSTTGTAFTNAPTTNKAVYAILGAIATFKLNYRYNATSGGTGATNASIPFGPAVTGQGGFGNNASSGYMVSVQADTTPELQITKYDGTTTIVNSNLIDAGIIFQI